MKLNRCKRVVASTKKGYRPNIVNAFDAKTYRNKRNPNKYVEVKRENDGHTSARQYMKWETDEGEVKNYNGSKSKRGRYSRMRKDSIDELLQDYDQVTCSGDSLLRTEVNYEGTRYSVRCTQVDTSPNADSVEMLRDFRGYVSEIHPYDEGDYAFAKFASGNVQYVRNNKVIDRSYYMTSEDWGLENGEWCDAVIDQIVFNLYDMNKDVEERIINNSTAHNSGSVNSSTVVGTLTDDDVSELRSELYTAGKNFMVDELFWEEDMIDDYFGVDVEKVSDDGYSGYRIEVGAEAGYDDLARLSEVLDPIVSSYEEDAYFEAETSGIIVCYIRYQDESIEECTSIEGSTYRDHDVEEQLVEVYLDTNIEVNDEGYFDYEDTSWATDLCGDDGWVQSYDYPNLDLIEEGSLIETIDDFLIDELPDTPGIYHVVANFELYFDVEGVYDDVNDGGWDDREGFWEDFDTISDNADVTYNKDKSKMTSFSCERSLN